LRPAFAVVVRGRSGGVHCAAVHERRADAEAARDAYRDVGMHADVRIAFRNGPARTAKDAR